MTDFPLIVACGLSGSGKTYNTQILEQKLPNYTRINLGDLRAQLGITHYSRKDTPKLLVLAFEKIEANHKAGKSTIIDANIKSADIRQCFHDLAKELDQQLILIHFFCSDELTKKRFSERDQKTKAENPKEYQTYLEQKKVWQDPSLDIELSDNGHLSLIRFNTETEKAEVVRQNPSTTAIIALIVGILEQNHPHKI